MSRRTRIIGSGLAIAVLAATFGITVLKWSAGHRATPQILTLPNGERFEFAGVTWSREAVPPVLLARVVHWLPSALANLVRKRCGARISQTNLGEEYPEPHLFVWYRGLGTNSPTPGQSMGWIPTAQLAGEDGIQSGVQGFPIFASGVAWSFVQFPVVPKRRRVLRCLFYPSGYGGEALVPFAKLSFPNPLFGHFPQWQPEPLPAVKTVGDLEVRLDAVESGHPISGATIERPNGGRAPAYEPIQGGQTPNQTGIDLSLRSAKGTNELWVMHSAELSDATGNTLRSAWTQAGDWLASGFPRRSAPGWIGYCESIPGTLWPDETAWHLKLELKRASGFDPAELVAFKKVPVPPMGGTNTVPITNTVNGTQVVLREFVHRANITNGGFGLGSMLTQVRVELPGKPKGTALDFLSMSTDVGQPAESYGHSKVDSGYLLFVKTIPTNAQTMDFTWLVQKTRTVEFTFKPPDRK